MLKLGMSVHDGGAYCGPVLQSDTAVARAIDVDRRVVRSTINHIMEVPELLNLFSRVESMLLLANAASEIGCSAIEIVPVDAANSVLIAVPTGLTLKMPVEKVRETPAATSQATPGAKVNEQVDSLFSNLDISNSQGFRGYGRY